MLIKKSFAAAGGSIEKFGEQFRQLEPEDKLLLYENGEGVLAIGRVKERWDGSSFVEPWYYAASEMSGLTGGEYEYRIPVDWFIDLSASPISTDHLREWLHYKPNSAVMRGVVKRIVKQRSAIERRLESLMGLLSIPPTDLSEENHFIEGARSEKQTTVVNRNQAAVNECKTRQGTKCVIFHFDFGEEYGPDFSGFIHIHHLNPISRIAGKHPVDPEKDLRPVCPNCHAVIHFGGKCRSIDNVRELRTRQKNMCGGESR